MTGRHFILQIFFYLLMLILIIKAFFHVWKTKTCVPMHFLYFFLSVTLWGLNCNKVEIFVQNYSSL